MHALRLLLTTDVPEVQTEATRQWAALLLAMLLLSIVLVVSLVLLMIARRQWGANPDRRKESPEIADAWAEAGRRATPPAETAIDDSDDPINDDDQSDD